MRNLGKNRQHSKELDNWKILCMTFADFLTESQIFECNWSNFGTGQVKGSFTAIKA